MFAKRLRLARKRSGLSMRELADKMNSRVTVQAISKYEAGKMLPSSSVLVELGKALDVSLDFLMSAQVESIDKLEFRKHSRASARDRAKAEAIMIDNLERYLAIEHILGMPNDMNWIENTRYDSVAYETQIDAWADKLRKAWNIGKGPISSVCEILEEKGIKVIEDDLPESVNGLGCHVLRDGKPVAEAVVVSNRINVERKRFTLAHELAHRLICSTGNLTITLEGAVDRFAGAFLLPNQSLQEEVGAHRQRITYSEIIYLKHKYGVSAAMVLVRLGQVGIQKSTAVRHAFATFARSWRHSEPEPIGPEHSFAIFERPRRFKRLVLRALSEELISPLRAAELLQLPLDSVEQLISGPSVR